MVLSQNKTFAQPGLLIEDRRGWLDFLPLHPIVLSPAIAVDVSSSCSRHGCSHIQSPAPLPGERGTRSKKTSRRVHQRPAKSLRPAHSGLPSGARVRHSHMRSGGAPPRHRRSSLSRGHPAIDLPVSACMAMECVRQQRDQTVRRRQTIHRALCLRSLPHSACTNSLDRRARWWIA